jgi:hypothetical protein
MLPVSELVMIAQRVLRIHNGDYRDEKEQERMLDEVQRMAEKALDRTERDDVADSVRITADFIRGGILGYKGTLSIYINPLEALMAGFQAVKLLEDVVRRDSSIADAFLGLGIFHCSVAKAPTIVQTALKTLGRECSLDTGLAYIRISAARGLYTPTVARRYLIQFLSPYFGHLTEEKFAVFDTLIALYPTNPYYTFLKYEEALCFHPSRFYTVEAYAELKKSIEIAGADNFSLKRYRDLLKWQYWILNPFAGANETPGISPSFREFIYYPTFIVAVSQKHRRQSTRLVHGIHTVPSETDIKRLGEEIIKRIDNSEMNLTRKNLYQWHVRDALRLSE